MSAHAKFPPSGADRWLHCGYSIKMAPFYLSTDTAASINGTNHHSIASMHLENETEPSDPKMRMYTDHVRESAEGGILYVERKVIIVPDLCDGTADAIALHPDHGHIIDLKWGKSAVHADTPQLKTYGIGMVQEFNLEDDFPIRQTIVQPNGTTGWPIKHWDTTAGDLLRFRDEKIIPAIEIGLSPNPPAHAGSWCFWCPVKPHCKAYLISRGKRK